MIKVHKLKRPTKLSGYHLRQGQTTEVKGLTVTNVSAGNNVYVDKFTKPKAKEA